MMSVLVLTTNLGWIQSTHYCLGRPMETDLGLEIAHLNCGMVISSGCSEEMEQKPGCCHNEFQKFSLDQTLLVHGLDFAAPIFYLALPFVKSPEVFLINSNDFSGSLGYQPKEPPPKETQLFIVYQQWLI